MDVVIHHRHRVTFEVIRGRNLHKQLLYCLGDLPNQHIPAVLRSPDDMVLQIVDCMSTCFVGHAEIVAALRAARFPPHSTLWGIQRDFS
jgi:hypothetical protein